MSKQPTISHTVNGYSRYDVPESKAFTCTPGILYPARIDFINARDRVTIAQGIDVRSNPLAVPTFNPYTVRLHRFWVPLQLYHPELRTNSGKFDMNDLSLNWIPFARGYTTNPTPRAFIDMVVPFPTSLLAWLRMGSKHPFMIPDSNEGLSSVELRNQATNQYYWFNADSYLAYWDIVRNYYSFSQWSIYSFAWPANQYYYFTSTGGNFLLNYSAGDFNKTFTQRYGNLEFLDAYFESQFYPSAVKSLNNTYNRSNLLYQIIASDISSKGSTTGDGYPVSTRYSGALNAEMPVSLTDTSNTVNEKDFDLFAFIHPLAVVPSSPDRFSRLLPPSGSEGSVSMSGIATIPQLAVASRLQEYKDLLGAGGSRYSDWLETFFASKIEHVDRPKLLFSASQTVNAQIVMNQAGDSNFTGSQPLGQQGGAIAFNATLGRSQTYYFREPGFLIDMFSIRPVYYWSTVTPDYLRYQGADYFNPIYNDIGYQDLSYSQLSNNSFNVASGNVFSREPCFNEFRASYDEVLGSFQPESFGSTIYGYWVQQRSLSTYLSLPSSSDAYSLLFVDMATVNSPFASNVGDNFFVNLSYSVQKKNLVNKTFATRLSNR